MRYKVATWCAVWDGGVLSKEILNKGRTSHLLPVTAQWMALHPRTRPDDHGAVAGFSAGGGHSGSLTSITSLVKGGRVLTAVTRCSPALSLFPVTTPNACSARDPPLLSTFHPDDPGWGRPPQHSQLSVPCCVTGRVSRLPLWRLAAHQSGSPLLISAPRWPERLESATMAAAVERALEPPWLTRLQRRPRGVPTCKGPVSPRGSWLLQGRVAQNPRKHPEDGLGKRSPGSRGPAPEDA